MQTAEEILGVRIRAHDFGARATEVVRERTQKKLKRVQRSFQKIVQEHGTYDREAEEFIAAAYRLFEEHYPSVDALKSAFDTRRMARRLSWALCYRKEEKVPIVRDKRKLRTALAVIATRWGWNSTFGIYDALLRHWDCDVTRPILQDFIDQRLESYEGSRPRLVRLRNVRRAFVKPSGPTDVASFFVGKGEPITALWETLRLPDHARGYPYVAEVGSAYTRSAMRAPDYREHIRPILKFLSQHDRHRTYKRCLSRIILRLDSGSPSDERERVLSAAFRKVGDPAHAPEWAPWDKATESERSDLQKARKALNSWIAQRFITAFFDQVAMDTDRRRFWLRYAPHITRFKVFGDGETRYQLRKDKRIKRYVNSRFDRISGSMAALLMQIKNRVIVEFGETGGACYVHRKGTSDCPSFDRRYSNINQLRIGTDFPLLMRYAGTHYSNVRSEGRFLHKHDWERRLDWWMKKKLGIEV